MKKIVFATLVFCSFWIGVNAQTAFRAPGFTAPSANKNLIVTPESKAFYKSEYDDYGGKLGIGISIFNGFSVPFRYYANPKNVFEASIGLGTVLIYDLDNDLASIESDFLVGAGYTFFNDRFLKIKKKRNKVRAHGVAIRASQLLGDFNSTFASVGWAMETFRENQRNHSFIFELGLQALFPNFEFEGQQVNEVRPGAYLRCHWNFFLK